MKLNGTFSIENGIVTISYNSEISFMGISASVKQATISLDLNQMIESGVPMVKKIMSNDESLMTDAICAYAKTFGIKKENIDAINDIAKEAMSE